MAVMGHLEFRIYARVVTTRKIRKKQNGSRAWEISSAVRSPDESTRSKNGATLFPKIKHAYRDLNLDRRSIQFGVDDLLATKLYAYIMCKQNICRI